MAISQIGALIRWRRSELGLSQEELADGICSVTTLSRIENGERMPTQNHMELLLQRIGYSDMMLQTFVDEKDFIAHELKYKLRQTYIEKDIEKARGLLQKFQALVPNPSGADEQFVLLSRVWCYSQNDSEEEQIRELEKAIQITHPNYKRGQVPYLLSYDEIVILNNIATRLAKCGHIAGSIDTLYGILRYYDSHVVNIEEAIRTEPMILYNLSKFLGLEGRYDECIEICDRGIQLAQKTGRSQCFATTLYNKAWALLKRGCPGDRNRAQETLASAFHVAEAFEDLRLMEHCKRFAQTNGLDF